MTKYFRGRRRKIKDALENQIPLFTTKDPYGRQGWDVGDLVKVRGYLRRLSGMPMEAPKVVPVVPHVRCWPNHCIHNGFRKEIARLIRQSKYAA